MRILAFFLFSTMLFAQPNIFATPSARAPLASKTQDATAKLFTPVSDKAVLYIYRGYGDRTKHFELYLDANIIAKTIERSFVRLEVQPGLHEIMARKKNDSSLQIFTESGKLYFINIQWYRLPGGLGWPLAIVHDPHKVQLQLLPEDDGRASVSRCSLLAMNSSGP